MQSSRSAPPTSACARLEAQVALVEMRIARRHVRRIGDDEVEAPAGQRVEPVALDELDRRAVPRGVLARDRERRGRDVRRGDPRARARGARSRPRCSRCRWRDRARGTARPAGMRSSASSTSSSVSGRGISTAGVTLNAQAVELALSGEVGDRLARAPALDQRQIVPALARRSARVPGCAASCASVDAAARRAAARARRPDRRRAQQHLRAHAMRRSRKLQRSARWCSRRFEPAIETAPLRPRSRRPGSGRLRLFGELGELLGLVLGGERRDQLVELAVHDPVDLVEREVDAVVGDAALRESCRCGCARSGRRCRSATCAWPPSSPAARVPACP